jgi:hypothetical protein
MGAEFSILLLSEALAKISELFLGKKIEGQRVIFK